MRSKRRTTKKLTLAFHFSRADQAGWKCDACRKAGLDEKRRCGWLGLDAGAAPVWARGGVAAYRCPKSLVTAESQGWLEVHTLLSRFGATAVMDLAARDVEAFFLIENEIAKGKSDG